MPPQVTILIPTYNRAGFLVQAIASAQAQAFRDVEILVLDDCSPDHTGDAVQPLLRDGRIRYVRHEKNMGIAANWRFGIEAARGEYFCILHDDDTLEPAFVERLVRPLAADESLILTFCDQWVMDAGGNRQPEESRKASRAFGRDRLAEGRLADFASVLLIANSIPAGAAMYRRRMVQPAFVDDHARGSIDMWLLYQCMKTGGGAYFIPECLMNYRVHAHGMSRSMPFEMIEGHLFRYRRMLDDPDLARLRPALAGRLAEVLEWHGMALLRSHRHVQSRQSFREAFRARRTAKAFLGLASSYFGKAGLTAMEWLAGVRRKPSTPGQQG
jgi:glycosyltransferase involved in cell wall biosynthesis